MALFIDGMMLLFVMVLVMYISEGSEWSTAIRVASGLLLSAIYEPFLTAFSATIGHRVMGIRVRDDKNPVRRISVGKAYARWFTKGALGWISFLTIHFNDKHQAIHDLIVSSVVIELTSVEMATV